MAMRVVVEVDVRVASVALQIAGPLPQGRPAIAASILARCSVEADVSPPPGVRRRGTTEHVMGSAPSCVPVEHLASILGVTRPAPEADGGGQALPTAPRA